MNNSERISGARFPSEQEARAAVASELMNVIAEVALPSRTGKAARRIAKDPSILAKETEGLAHWTQQERGRVNKIIRGKRLT